MQPLLPQDPRIVGGYELTGRLGAGGMGAVYLGRSPGGRAVAVKVVHPHFGMDPSFRRRFATEVAAARRVGGFFTAQVVDADPEADPPWLVTAYVPGPSLHELVARRGPLGEADLRSLAGGLAEGLAAIHACGLIHRDLKPGNVIMAADGPRIIDFGIARALDLTSHTVTGTVLGTPAYMSPEQARGEPTGRAGDVFSLGSVLAYAATGRGPFDAETVSGVNHRIINEEPDLTRVPDGVRGLISACLAKRAERRPALEDVLDLARGRHTGPDRPVSRPKRPNPAATRAEPPDPESFRRDARPAHWLWAAPILALCVCLGVGVPVGALIARGDYSPGSFAGILAVAAVVGVVCWPIFRVVRGEALRRAPARELTLDRHGLRAGTGKHTVSYRWSELTMVTVTDNCLTVRLHRKTPAPPSRKHPDGRPHLNPSTGQVILLDLTGFPTPPPLIANAIADHAGPRWHPTT